jgi:aspartokinase
VYNVLQKCLCKKAATDSLHFCCIAQVLHPSAMFPAHLAGDCMAIRVRNSYNLAAHGSTICDVRDRKETLLTSIVLKQHVHLLDIVSTRMLGNFGFLARVFDIFKQEEISVDVVATSEISVSVTLDSAKLWSRDLISEELEHLASRFKGVAKVDVKHGVSIISLICNASRSSAILKQVRPQVHYRLPAIYASGIRGCMGKLRGLLFRMRSYQVRGISNMVP